MVIKMNYKIEDNSLVICPNIIKDNILLNLSKNKQLINVKFINIEEFKDNYFGTYKDDAMYFLLKNFNINYCSDFNNSEFILFLFLHNKT